MTIRKYPMFWQLALIALAGFLVMCKSQQVQPSKTSMTPYNYIEAWERVDSLEKLEQYRSALSLAEDIHDAAVDRNNSVQKIKSLVYLSKYAVRLNEDGFEDALGRMEDAVQVAEGAERALLYSLLAEMYSGYLQMHAWKLRDRRHLPGPGEGDVRTWSIEQLIERINTYYVRSMDEPLIREVSVTAYDGVLTDGNVDSLRPTLYDFLAHRAIDYFQLDYAFVTKPSYAAELNNPDLLLPWDRFIAADIKISDTSSAKAQVLDIFRDLLTFHATDADPAALIDADLKRLQFVHTQLVHEDKDSLYEEALQSLYTRYGAHPAAAEVAYQIAQHNYQVGDAGSGDPAKRWLLRDARDLCDRTIARWPGTFGAQNCRNLLRALNDRVLQVETEEVWYPDEHHLVHVRYRNVARAFVRVVPLSHSDAERLTQGNERALQYLRRLPVLQQKAIDLPGTDDLRQHTTETFLDALPLGDYAVLISEHERFDRDAHVSYTTFQVSRLAFWLEADHNVARGHFVVVDRRSGAPLPGVKVEFLTRVYEATTRRHQLVEIGSTTTSADGLARLPDVKDTRNIVPRLTLGNDVLFLRDQFNPYWTAQRQKKRDVVFLFTDRAIYRPGQTIHFKGYYIAYDTDGMPVIASADSVEVELKDVSNQTVSKQTLPVNTYGTFSGTFTAPDDRLPGRMALVCGGLGRRDVRVEEYKRPTFEVTFDEPRDAFQLDGPVSVSGTAMTYAGVPVDRGTVTYRVMRRKYYPFLPWWRRSGWFPQQSEMVIAHGQTQTNERGAYTLEFIARSDNRHNRERPEYEFAVQVDVTDITGETRSAVKRIVLGTVGFRAQVALGENEDLSGLEAVPITATNLNGEPMRVSGEFLVEKLATPSRSYRDRLWSSPDQLLMSEAQYRTLLPDYAVPGKEEIQDWAISEDRGGGQVSFEGKDTLDLRTSISEPGAYKVTFRLRTSPEDTLTLVYYAHCADLRAGRLPTYRMMYAEALTATAQPGDTTVFRLASQVPVNARFTVDRPGGSDVEWLKWEGSAEEKVVINEPDRGGVFMELAYVFNGRFHQQIEAIRVPWTNKELKIAYLSVRDKTEPGAEEEWELRVTGSRSEGVLSEMLASMYDASLDVFADHDWRMQLYPGHQRTAYVRVTGFQVAHPRVHAPRRATDSERSIQKVYRSFDWFGFPLSGIAMRERSGVMLESAMAPAAMPDQQKDTQVVYDPDTYEESMVPSDEVGQQEQTDDLAPPPLQIRRDLEETAFFFPHVVTGKDGTIVLRFKMKEALTRWKFMALAHTADLAYGFSEMEVVTQKEIMVFPHMPRFVRQNDDVWVTAKVHNISDQAVTVSVDLELDDPQNDTSLLNAFGVQPGVRHQLNIPASSSESVRWQLSVPDQHVHPVRYRIIAMAGNKGDGEEGMLPVLTDRVFVTESMAMHVPSGSTRVFSFDRLELSTSETLRHHQYTVEFTSNPAWYAVQALPYLQEYPHACAEQMFNRLYANLLGGHIVRQFPAIQRVFDQWRSGDAEALLSNLSRNQELKSALLAETPWVLDALSEEEQKRNVALLFDLHQLDGETFRTLRTLKEMQLSNGGFPWFAGGRDSWYITQYLVESAGHLGKLGAINDAVRPELEAIVRPALRYIDDRLLEHYRDLEEQVREGKAKWEDNHLNAIAVHYLYARSFFMDIQQSEAVRNATAYYLQQAEQYWTGRPLYTEALIALSLKRWTASGTVGVMRKSFEERTLFKEELGRYWNASDGYFWYEMPIERQALMIEFFEEVGAEKEWLDELRLWLLTNKQTNRWKTTKATAAAIYALLIHPDNWLEGVPATVHVGQEPLSMEDPEAGTLYTKQSWTAGEVTSELGSISVNNPNTHAAWGGAYWQYFEDIDAVSGSTATPLKLQKEVYKEVMTDGGPVLQTLTDGAGVAVGDKLIVRLVLEVDRPMEFIHLKDMRGSGLEPLNVLSQYKWQGGLGYYESTADLATHFFFDMLPRGKWVFEYPLRVAHAGTYSNGIATIQSMYAPEFSSHSASVRLTVR
ncbi:MAG: alpha-2-macroglobulin family protein [Saprospiraceae bacterium]|nr:alpha-2-macroglobulin family protein [Saprospiraceae bacterium]